MFHVKRGLLLIAMFFPLFTFAQHFSSSTIEVKPLPPMPARDASIDQFLQSAAASLGPEEKEWFYWTNFSRSKPKVFWDSVVAPILVTFPNLKTSYTASLKKDLYKAETLSLLKPNEKLMTLAQSHAKELQNKNAPPSHDSPSGVTFQSRMMSGGVQKCAGENLSFGPSNTVLALLFLFIDEGIPDLGHRKALLSPDYKEMGVGLATYKNGNTLVIQDFSCPQ